MLDPEERMEVFPVKGQVSFRGEPATGAFVVLHPAAAWPDVPKPTGKVAQDGSFQLTTYEEGDGAPPGEYAVTVEWRKLVNQAGDFSAGPNVIPPKYSQPQTSPLTVTINESPNDLPAIEIEK